MNRRALKPIVVALSVFAVIFIAVALYLAQASTKTVSSSQTTEDKEKLPDFSTSLSTVDKTNIPVSKQIIGGDLKVTGAANFSSGISSSTITIRPTTNTSSVKAGQLYSTDDNSLYYYDGQNSINLSSVEEIKTKVGQLTTDTESLLAQPEGVVSLQGQSGNVVLTGANGVAIKGTTITNTGVITVQGKTGEVTFTGGNGVSVVGTTIFNTGVTQIGSLTGSVAIGNGLTVTGGKLVSTGITQIESGSSDIVVTPGGDGTYTIGYAGSGVGGTVALGPTAAQQDSGANPSIWVNKTGTGNLLQLSTGSSPVNRFVVDQTGTVTAGGFIGNGSGVTNVNAARLNGQSASFYLDATNISTGTLSDSRLSTNIARLNAASTTFIGGVTAATLSGNGAGVTNVNASQLGGQTGAYYLNASNINTGTLADGRLSANVALLDATANVFAGSLTADSLSGNGSGLTNVNALQLGGQNSSYYLSASNLTAGTLNDARLSSNVALLDATTNNFTGTLQHAGNTVCDNSNNCNYLTGSAASGAYIQLQSSSPGSAQVGNFNITGIGRANTLYQNGNQVCDTSGNCTGLGGEVTGSGTNGTIAVFTGTGTSLGNSLLSQTAGTVTVGGALAATSLSGDGSGLTSVNASQLNGQGASYYLNADNISTGTLADGRLSANVAKLDATNNFTGTLQHAGNTVCDNSNNCNYLTGSAANGAYIQLQALTPGVAQTGNLNITGTAIAGNFSGNGANISNVNAAKLGGNDASFYLNASNINTGTLADGRLSANVALLDSATTNFTGVLQQNGQAVCNVSNNCNYLTQLTANDIYIQLQSSTPGSVQTGNFNISGTGKAAALYQNGSQVCDTSGNCNGLGGQVSGSGTSGTLALFTGGNTIGNSILTQSGTDLTVAGTLTATSLGGNGASVTNVDALKLGGQLATYYQNASNITAGTLADGRLSSNVALLNGGNTFSAANTFSTSITTPLLQSATDLQIAAGNNLAVQSTGAYSATFDSGTTGAVNVGTGNNQKAITIGNATSATSLALKAGTGGINIGSSGVANTIQIGNISGAVAQTINIGNNATASSSTTLVLGSAVGTSPVTLQSGSSGVLVKGGNSTTAFNIQNSNSTATLFTVNTVNNVVGVGSAPASSGATLQVTGTQSISSDLTVSGRIYAGQSGINVYNGSTSSDILYGSGGTVTLQKVSIATNNTVKIGTSMGLLYTDGSGNLQVLDVSGQSGNCVGYNGTTVTWQGCSGSGGGSTGFSNGGNAYTANPGSATSRYGASYDATITNPVIGLTGNNAFDIITNNQSRIRIQNDGDVMVQSGNLSGESYAESASKFTVRTYNNNNVEQYINTLVVDTQGHGLEYGGRVGIGLKVGTTPEVTLDIAGGRNNYGGSGIQIRASAAPGLSTAGGQGDGSLSTGRIYYDQQDRKFKVSENGGAWTDLVVGSASSSPVLQGGNTMSATLVMGNKRANYGGDGVLIGVANNDSAITSGFHVDANGRYVFDRPINDNNDSGFRILGGVGDSLTVDSRYSVVSIGGANSNGSNTYGNLVVGGNGIRTTSIRVGLGSEDIGIDASCASSQQTIDAPVFKKGILVKYGGCRANNSDLAEAYNSTDNLKAGELVMSAGTAATSVSRAAANGESMLMGVVSTNPSQTLGTAQVPNGYPIALSGRVPTKVNAEGGAIKVGDKITISSVPGVGKKATGAGMVVGTAVEEFNGTGTGSIEVFVNLMYYNPVDGNNLQSQTGSFSTLNVSGATTLDTLTVTGKAHFEGDIVVNGHIITAGSTPAATIAATAGAGASVSVEGNDTAGTITVRTGSGADAGELSRLTFSKSFGASPRIVMTPQNGDSAEAIVFIKSKTAAGFVIESVKALKPNTTYVFDYFIVQ